MMMTATMMTMVARAGLPLSSRWHCCRGCLFSVCGKADRGEDQYLGLPRLEFVVRKNAVTAKLPQLCEALYRIVGELQWCDLQNFGFLGLELFVGENPCRAKFFQPKELIYGVHRRRHTAWREVWHTLEGAANPAPLRRAARRRRLPWWGAAYAADP